jgi:hypothetical protein
MLLQSESFGFNRGTTLMDPRLSKVFRLVSLHCAAYARYCLIAYKIAGALFDR